MKWKDNEGSHVILRHTAKKQPIEAEISFVTKKFVRLEFASGGFGVYDLEKTPYVIEEILDFKMESRNK